MQTVWLRILFLQTVFRLNAVRMTLCIKTQPVASLPPFSGNRINPLSRGTDRGRLGYFSLLDIG